MPVLTRVPPLTILALSALLLLSGCSEREEVVALAKPQSLKLALDRSPNADLVGVYAALAGGDFRAAGLNVGLQKPLDRGAPLDLLAAGRVDLALARESQLLRARERGLNLVSVGVILQRPKRALEGVPNHSELIVVAREDLGGQGAQIRRFMQALTSGYGSARANPKRGVAALAKANPDLDREPQLESVKATLPRFFPKGDRPFGYQSRSEWARYGEWMRRNGLLERSPYAAKALTNEFLPGEGL